MDFGDICGLVLVVSMFGVKWHVCCISPEKDLSHDTFTLSCLPPNPVITHSSLQVPSYLRVFLLYHVVHWF